LPRIEVSLVDIGHKRMAVILCHIHSWERHGTLVLQFLIHKHTSAGVLRYTFLFLFIIHVCLALLKVRVGILF
jgi:hypothetical protein